MKKYKYILVFLNLALLLWLFNQSVSEKEGILKSGKLVLLELSSLDTFPDPQRNFLNLHYPMSDVLDPDSLPRAGFCIVKTDDNGVASFQRYQAELAPLKDGEQAIAYFVKNYRIQIGANTYYFQQGQSTKFNAAKYAGLKVDNSGSSVLFGLYDAQFVRLE